MHKLENCKVKIVKCLNKIKLNDKNKNVNYGLKSNEAFKKLELELKVFQQKLKKNSINEFIKSEFMFLSKYYKFIYILNQLITICLICTLLYIGNFKNIKLYK